MLEQVFLSRNRISEIGADSLSSLSQLRILALQNNKLEEIANLEALINLEELYLSNNRICRIEGLRSNVSAGWG